jgi:DNA end-binding protein Ku
MEKLNVAAIAKVTLHQREQIVLMRPYHQGIILHTLYFPAEVREVSEYGKTENMTLQKPEIDLAEQFIRQLTAKFEPEQYKDEYQQRVLEMIETKRAGQVVAGQAPKPKLAPVIDLMEALKKSIAERGTAAAAAPASAPELVEPSKKKAPKSSPAAEAKPARGRKTG